MLLRARSTYWRSSRSGGHDSLYPWAWWAPGAEARSTPSAADAMLARGGRSGAPDVSEKRSASGGVEVCALFPSKFFDQINGNYIFGYQRLKFRDACGIRPDPPMDDLTSRPREPPTIRRDHRGRISCTWRGAASCQMVHVRMQDGPWDVRCRAAMPANCRGADNPCAAELAWRDHSFLPGFSGDKPATGCYMCVKDLAGPRPAKAVGANARFQKAVLGTTAASVRHREPPPDGRVNSESVEPVYLPLVCAAGPRCDNGRMAPS